MCLLLIAIDAVPGVPLLLLGNRDEFHARASAPAQAWSEDARVAGGRDLVAGGAWLAARGGGRFAAVTNLRTGVPATAPRSRGWLVRDYVLGRRRPVSFLEGVAAEAGDYGPFNLLVGDGEAFALGSADGVVRRLGAGIHVVSNGPIGVHWPKTARLRQRFADVIDRGWDDDEARLLDLLADEARPPDAALPDTGVGLELERRLAPIFIRGERYGTRAATLLMRHADATLVLRERRFAADAVAAGETRMMARGDGVFVATAC